MKALRYISLLFLAFLLSACVGNWERWVDTSEQEVRILRYDKVVNDYVTMNSYTALQRLNGEYSMQTTTLIEDVLEIGQVEDKDIDRKLRIYYNDSIMRKLSYAVAYRFKDMAAEEEALTEVFGAIRKADTAFVMPVVYTQVCGLNESIIINDSLVAIGLDKYLGQNFPLYKEFYHSYQRRSMDRHHIVEDVLYYYLYSFYDTAEEKNLLQRMVHSGRIHWIMAELLNLPLNDMLHFKGERRAWCVRNKHMVWEWMKKNNMFETKDEARISEFMEPGAYTSYFGSESSDLLGVWLGAQIVESYMKLNRNKTWQDLLHMDWKDIYENSGYNP